MKALHSIFEDIRAGRNLGIYITILLGLGVGLFSIFGDLEVPTVLGVTLMTLSLLAFQLLGSRHLMREYFKSRRLGAESFFLEQLPDSIKDDIKAADKEICLSGMSLKRTVVTYHPILRERLDKNVRVRILLIAPEGEGVYLGGAAYHSTY